MHDNNKPNPSPSIGNREKSESNDRVVTESIDYGEFIKGGFEVVNSMPPPPNPNRGGNKDNQGDQ